MLTYCKLDGDPKEHISMKSYLKFTYSHSRNCLWTCCLWNGNHFVGGGGGGGGGGELKFIAILPAISQSPPGLTYTYGM